ncbi:MAG: alcohol dehydrogenase catalytic domain-containing protein [Candidatus Eremiobacteraeota bacterium]|nr:alcohol dehydrogenase catalytic domain-containing protein [Candidatus Eremiobacteraeota bacterium]MBV8355958.1 alcohol dehydrogenase catalytic domain-containing protein [Candidatus Eremiobacteraeota bacterium]
MRAILKSKPTAGVELVTEYPEPEAGPGQVLVEVAATSLCGTDAHIYAWDKSAQAFNPRIPFVLGHECAGTIVKVGENVDGLRAGDRVAAESHIFCGRCYMCRTGNAHNCYDMKLLGLTWPGAFANYVALPAQVCFPLPASLPLEFGALFEPSGVAVHAIQRAGNLDGCSVLVSGAGPIGLTVIQLARRMGASSIVALEPNPFRRKLAERYGARALDPRETDLAALVRKDYARHGGFDVGFEISAAPGTIQTLLEHVRREATVVCVGHPSEPISLDVATYLTKKMVVLKGIFGRRIWDTWELLLSMVESNALDLSGLITHRLSLDEFDRGIELLRGESAKVLMMPGG